MATIGTFKQTKAGYEGTIATLSMTHKVKFVTNKNKKNEDSPDFFIKSGRSDFGVAWKETKDGGLFLLNDQSNLVALALLLLGLLVPSIFLRRGRQPHGSERYECRRYRRRVLPGLRLLSRAYARIR